MPTVPSATQFAGFGAPTPCAPIVIDSSTGYAYSMTAGGTVVAFGIGGGVLSLSAPNGVLAVSSASGALALAWSGVTAGSLITAVTATGLGVVSAAASGNLLLSNGLGALPQYGKADLSLYVSGDLPFSNLTQISGMAVLGVAGSATADVAGIRAASDYFVLRASGSAIGFRNVGNVAGTATNDSAATGNLGEYIESVTGIVAVNGTTGQYKDITSISLTAGDWDVSGVMQFEESGGSAITYFGTGISVTAGNDATGLVQGSSFLNHQPNSAVTVETIGIVIPSLRMSLAGTTTVYLKCYVNYTIATPNTSGARLSARRVR